MIFESGVLPEPLITFGGHRHHVDPKAGLELYGPYSPIDEASQGSRTIGVGIVGPADLIGDAERWLAACAHPIRSHDANPFQSPSFPGFNLAGGFRSLLQTGRALQHPIRSMDMERALGVGAGPSRVSAVSDLYVDSIKLLAERDRPPDVVICCISEEIKKKCLVGAPEKVAFRRKVTKAAIRRSDRQLDLFGTGAAEEEDFDTYLDLWKAIKAGAMQHSIPTQLLLEDTLKLTNAQGVQDLATRVWNFSVGIYHKAGGSPWRLANIDTDVCFVGISFFRDNRTPGNRIETSVAQAFTAAGDGYVLRGQPFEWDARRTRERTPHMDRNAAAVLMRSVLDQYRRQHGGQTPARLVLHKSSRYWNDELQGLLEGSTDVPAKDFVAFRPRGIQLYRQGDYPPLRGTYVKFDKSNLLLYTRGYIPYFMTYPGARSPQPLEIAEHVGDSPWTTVLSEILALTKMNWNTADFSGGAPITLSFAKRVGMLLSELNPEHKIRPEYRFYM